MKNFIIDVCLVGLFVFLINGLLNDYNIRDTVFEREITQFEDDIQNDEVINYEYGITSDDSENLLSLVIKGISDFCISAIETIVLIISNFISMLV
ncbi:MAG: hypothetical protein ACK5LC_12375 [Coprobacillaceae bacterium]